MEVKKSSKLKEPARWQLKYYLYLLRKVGGSRRSGGLFPTRRRERARKLNSRMRM